MQRKRHATEHVVTASLTLCGEPYGDGSILIVDNCAPDCKRCLRVIRSRCARHNVKRCKVCPRDGNIGA